MPKKMLCEDEEII